MTPAVRESVEKAEEDWTVALRESRAKLKPVHSVVSFHAQQCAEKYFKAVLAQAGTPIPKLHDLLALQTLVVPICLPLGAIRSGRLASLSRAAVEYRYPGGRVTRRMAEAAMRTAKGIRSLARAAIGL